MRKLEPIVQDYQTQLFGWDLVQKDTLIRVNGPILQGITFERLSSGVYRPMAYIRVLTVPQGGGMLTQYLNVKVRSVKLAEHDRMRDRVVEAMRREFVPNVTHSLNPMRVLKLCEREAVPTGPQAYLLASLNAYLGRKTQALHWCSRYTELVDAHGRPWQDSENERHAFLDLLEQWINEGTEKQHLERVLQTEREKWKLE